MQEAKGKLTLSISEEEITTRLIAASFTSRALTPFQLRDLRHLLSLQHGANFSVPGAGKTTVTLALHILTRKPGQHLLVVGPNQHFPLGERWSVIVSILPHLMEMRSPSWFWQGVRLTAFDWLWTDGVQQTLLRDALLAEYPSLLLPFRIMPENCGEAGQPICASLLGAKNFSLCRPIDREPLDQIIQLQAYWLPSIQHHFDDFRC